MTVVLIHRQNKEQFTGISLVSQSLGKLSKYQLRATFLLKNKSFENRFSGPLSAKRQRFSNGRPVLVSVAYRRFAFLLESSWVPEWAPSSC